jgi:hypothetical protein
MKGRLPRTLLRTSLRLGDRSYWDHQLPVANDCACRGASQALDGGALLDELASSG